MEYYKNLDLEDIQYIDDEGKSKIEQWKDIDKFIGRYQISNLGRAKSLERLRSAGNGSFCTIPTKILRQTPDRDGYRTIGLRMPGVNDRGKIHRLVAIAFIPNPIHLPEVNHIGLYENGKEGNKNDNRVISLKWETRAGNQKHACINGLTTQGESHPSSKLTEKEVLEIRESNLSPVELGKLYNTNRTNIIKIVNRQRWKHI